MELSMFNTTYTSRPRNLSNSLRRCAESLISLQCLEIMGPQIIVSNKRQELLDLGNLVLNQLDAIPSRIGKRLRKMLRKETSKLYQLISTSNTTHPYTKFMSRIFDQHPTLTLEEYGCGDLQEQVRVITQDLISEMTFTLNLRTNGGVDIPDRK